MMIYISDQTHADQTATFKSKTIKGLYLKPIWKLISAKKIKTNTTEK